MQRHKLRGLVERIPPRHLRALPVMATLHVHIDDTQSIILLNDRNGVMLYNLGSNGFVEKARCLALHPGVTWSETGSDTNAISTSLADGRPTFFYGREHFFHARSILTRSCAPISEPYDNSIGAVDVISKPRRDHKHTLALCQCPYRPVENHLFANSISDAARFYTLPNLAAHP